MLVLQVVCDCCNVLGWEDRTGAHKAHVLRDRLKAAGWTYKGKADFCPSCTAWKRAKGDKLA